MQINTLKEALMLELEDLYNAEQQLVQGLPRMASAASHRDLKMAFEQHLTETKNQVARLERVFSLIGQQPQGETCEAMQGLITEAEEVISASGDKEVKDAVLIGAAQRVEHYEMAGYGTARAFAKQLGLDDIADLLEETLEEESAADKKLTTLAEGGIFSSGVNQRARSTKKGEGSEQRI
jgi:ferritin-like metal-binding protein YciE